MATKKVMTACKNCDRQSYHDPEDPNWLCMWCLHSQQSTIELNHVATITIKLYIPKTFRLEAIGKMALNTFVYWYETKLPALAHKFPKKVVRLETDMQVHEISEG
jgi:hypothetical protein